MLRADAPALLVGVRSLGRDQISITLDDAKILGHVSRKYG
jgi:hypothetical protein